MHLFNEWLSVRFVLILQTEIRLIPEIEQSTGPSDARESIPGPLRAQTFSIQL